MFCEGATDVPTRGEFLGVPAYRTRTLHARLVEGWYTIAPSWPPVYSATTRHEPVYLGAKA